MSKGKWLSITAGTVGALVGVGVMANTNKGKEVRNKVVTNIQHVVSKKKKIEE